MRRVFIALTIMLAAGISAAAQDAGWIGVSIDDQADRGAIVRRVEPDSPADRAGLKEGDVILEFNRQDVIGAQQLTRLVRETPVGRTVDVKIRRDNSEQNVQVTTDRASAIVLRSGRTDLKLPQVNLDLERLARDVPKVMVLTTFTQRGIRVDSMTDQLRTFFGVGGDTGVLVTSVDAGSAAERAGLKAGDVIIAVDGKTIRTPADFSREMRIGGAQATLRVLRDKREQELKL